MLAHVQVKFNIQLFMLASTIKLLSFTQDNGHARTKLISGIKFFFLLFQLHWFSEVATRFTHLLYV